MKNNTTEIKNPDNPEDEPKRFTFDYSYWSHDEFNERNDGYLEPAGSRYADQVSFLLYIFFTEVNLFMFVDIQIYKKVAAQCSIGAFAQDMQGIYALLHFVVFRS